MSKVNASTAVADNRPEAVLENTTKGGSPPQKRIGSALAAQRIYDDLCSNSAAWAQARARIQGVYDGNPPFRESDLTRLGQSHRCNVNFRELESIIDTNAAAAWSLHMDIGPLIDCKIDSYYLPTDGSGEEWTDIISEEYTRTLLEWPSFYYNVDAVTKDSFKYGVGGMVWPDEYDWRAKVFQIGNLKVPPRANLDPEKLDLFCLSDEYTIHELYSLIENRANSEKAGWDVGALKRVLVKKYAEHSLQQGSDNTEQTSDWESLQTAIRTYDPGWAVMEYDGVRVVHIVVKEALEKTGTTGEPEKSISHYIFPDECPDRDVEFLFSKDRRFRTMQQVLWLLPHNYGDGGKIRSIKGLGHRSLPHCEFSNRFLCQLFDSGMLASSLIVQLQKAADTDELQMLRMGPVTVIPAALTPVQTSFVPKMDSLVGLRSLSKDILLNNTGVYRPRLEQTTPQAAYPTAQQVRQEAKTEAKFEHSQSTFFYIQWQAWHQETFRRMTNTEYLMSSLNLRGQKEAQQFVLRCMQRGVPPSILMTPGIVRVYSARALGMGSQEDRQMITNQLELLKGAMDEKGRRWVDRQWAAARIGAWNVDKVFPRDSRDNVPSNATSLAVLENNSALDGRAPLVGSDQPHYAHALTHLQVLTRFAEIMLKMGPQGIPNIMEAANAFRLLLPHLEDHVARLQQDPSRKLEMQQWLNVIAQLKQTGQVVLKAADQVQAQRVQQMQDQQNGSGEDQGMMMAPEMRMKQEKMRFDLMLEKSKQDSLNAMRAAKTAESNDIRRSQADAAAQLAAQKAAAEIQLEKAKVEAKIALEAAKQAGGE